ncbi:MAG: hypothetical protein AAF718_08490 [Pseudomonadota bacterium]
MGSAQGNEVAFDAHVYGAPNADVQPKTQGSEADRFVYDVNTVLDTLQAQLSAGMPGLDAFATVVGQSISVRGSGFQSDFRWLGPAMRIPTEATSSDSQFAKMQAAAMPGFLSAVTSSIQATPVSLGVADTSIAFVNRRFRKRDASGNATKTRFKFLWLQDRYFKNAASAAPYSSIFRIGTVLLEADINRLIADNWKNGALDEAAVYRAFQSVRSFGRDLWSLGYGHGTSVLDLMAGAEPGGLGDDRPLYGIEFPTAVVADTSGSTFHGPMVTGLAAVSFLSQVMSPGALVMNSSISFVGGPHANKRGSQKTHPTAAALKRLVDISRSGRRDVLLTLPSGNHLQDQLFSEADSVTWVVQPDDKTGSTVEIWNTDFSDFSGGAKVTITAPGQSPVQFSRVPAIGKYVQLLDADGNEIGRLYRAHSPGFLEDHLVFAIHPTQSFDPDQPLSPAGNWLVECKPKAGGKCLFWSSRDDTLAGLPEAGRQARFRDPSYNAFDTSGDWQTSAEDDGSGVPKKGVSRAGSGSVLAYGQHGGGAKPPLVIVIGDEASRATGRSVYRFAGLEMDRLTHQKTKSHHGKGEPRAESSRALGGPQAAKRRGRGKIRWAGTSMASATEARLTADALTGVDTFVDSKSGNNFRDY